MRRRAHPLTLYVGRASVRVCGVRSAELVFESGNTRWERSNNAGRDEPAPVTHCRFINIRPIGVALLEAAAVPPAALYEVSN